MVVRFLSAVLPSLSPCFRPLMHGIAEYLVCTHVSVTHSVVLAWHNVFRSCRHSPVTSCRSSALPSARRSSSEFFFFSCGPFLQCLLCQTQSTSFTCVGNPSNTYCTHRNFLTRFNPLRTAQSEIDRRRSIKFRQPLSYYFATDLHK